ncbi:MAG TPA: Xaa-Pro peptidase family protein [Candidatus Bathyarchaeia archaeon]|nr:Xaa-Pro peptidase family protein [Candidatus Bathyarchaeia archaeon]
MVISQAEHRSRVEKIRDQLRRSKSAALYLTNPTRILYATGFSHISTERPLALVIPQDGTIFVMGPHLEEDHVRSDSRLIQEFFSYPDYPGNTHPIRHFVKVLREKGLAGAKIATDSFDGAAGGWGYRGPSLRDLLKRAKMVDSRDMVDNLRRVKSKQEIHLLKESARWAEKAHDILIENIGPGEHDALVGVKASYEALTRMMKKLGAKYRQLKWGLSPVVVGCRGQVGPGSAIPHSVFSQRRIRKGDVLVTEAGVEIGGYTSELERTVIVGAAGPTEKKHFETMLRAQDAALGEFKPGAPCFRVDEAARKAVEAVGLADALRHHAGHGIGIDGHEPPWLDPGEKTIMKTGMVFSCEPGLYVPGFAGFRHSDTIAVSKDGMEFITEYPRGLDELTV